MNTSRYRYVNWIGNRILEARELITFEGILRGVDSGNNRTTFDLNALYFEGATFNITPVVTPNSTTVTLTPTNASNPMLVFVRGRWEVLQTGEAAPVTLQSGQVNLYLNWQLLIRTNTDDPTLVDSFTGQPTAQMGELALQITGTDTSGTALNSSTQFEKNTTPIVLFTFAHSGNSLTLVSSTSVNGQALASKEKGGFVLLTTDSSSGVAASSDDSRLSDQRTPLDNSVTDAKVTTPTADAGRNYTSVTTGISDAKIVHLPTSQTVSAAIETTRSTANTAAASIAGHINQPLGPGVHPMPTAVQVGAAPLSHVTLPLGVAGSHPPQVNADSGGFQVIRDPGAAAAAMDPAVGVLMGGALRAGLLHNGDVYSALAQALVASPLQEAGDPALVSGQLGLLSTVAGVLSQHVNKTSHKNPHGVACSDIGAATTTSVTAAITTAETFATNADTVVLNSAKAYTDSKFTQSLLASGWYSFPGGFTIQWGQVGTVTSQSGSSTVTFPKQFTNACFSVVATTLGDIASQHDRITYVDPASISRNGFKVSNNGSGAGASWIAVGW